jgi:hypothetical protein
MDTHTAETLVPEPSFVEMEIAVGKIVEGIYYCTDS